jgi:hypothetical protein
VVAAARGCVESRAGAQLQRWPQPHAHLVRNPQPLPGLWEDGTYWHLETRQEELAQIGGAWGELRKAASAVDAALRGGEGGGGGGPGRHRTLCHGDAKSANFMFARGPGGAPAAAAAYDFQVRSPAGCGGGPAAGPWAAPLPPRAAAARLDRELLPPPSAFTSTRPLSLSTRPPPSFHQYVGGGYGAKDVVYLLVSSVDEEALAGGEGELLAHYHAVLTQVRPWGGGLWRGSLSRTVGSASSCRGVFVWAEARGRERNAPAPRRAPTPGWLDGRSCTAPWFDNRACSSRPAPPL